ncbi:hypothetical protein Cgig2_020373 [Carnegiea gigantea]|uniref:Uncharacterized protein n=1 Tax=Carnegiea gigantea TaxID=171969 RepID=A0A9Q1KD55_9CARY|nr:hypothetical protein Cgig2_020373 [Carnegiea gigantea]
MAELGLISFQIVISKARSINATINGLLREPKFNKSSKSDLHICSDLYSDAEYCMSTSGVDAMKKRDYKTANVMVGAAMLSLPFLYSTSSSIKSSRPQLHGHEIIVHRSHMLTTNTSACCQLASQFSSLMLSLPLLHSTFRSPTSSPPQPPRSLEHYKQQLHVDHHHRRTPITATQPSLCHATRRSIALMLYVYLGDLCLG